MTSPCFEIPWAPPPSGIPGAIYAAEAASSLESAARAPTGRRTQISRHAVRRRQPMQSRGTFYR